MSNPIRTITNYLDTQIEANLGIKGVKFHGLSILVEGDDTYPVPDRQNISQKILPDPAIPLQIYHRINSIRETSIEGWGTDDDTDLVAGLSLFGIGDQATILKSLDSINVDVAYEVFDAMPRVNVEVSTDISAANITDISLVTDRATIFQQEYRGNPVLLEHILNLVAFRIDYTVTARICNSCP